MFYTVLSLAALAAITSYSSGASIEASFIRAVVVLLICTILGYALNIAMDLSARNQMLTTVLDAQGSEINMGATRGAQASPDKPAKGPNGARRAGRSGRSRSWPGQPSRRNSRNQ